MVGQRLGRWRGEAGRREAGAVGKRGLRQRAAAATKSSLRSWPRRGCSGAGNDRPLGFSRFRAAIPAARPQVRRPCGPLVPPLPHPLFSRVPPLSLPRTRAVQSSLLVVPPRRGSSVTSPGPALREPAVASFSGGACREGEVICKGQIGHHTS